jgi:hypothetical protein
MKMLLGILGLAGAFALADTAMEQRAGSSLAIAQSSSACVENCMNVRHWPEAQCRRYCRGKSKR